MEILDKLLEERGLTFDQLQGEERTMYFRWMEQLSVKELTIDDVKTYVSGLRKIIEKELATSDLTAYGIFGFLFTWRKNKDLFLKARLKNIMLLEDMLVGPEQAKKSLEEYIKSLPKGKGV